MTAMSVPRSTSATASRSAFSITAPVGLLGKASTSAFVRGVMACRSSSAVRRNPFSAFSGRDTGTPPASVVSGA